ncbi:MAG: LysE family translocator [Hyphomicrobiales bacterium]|nr:LysE family translocator [Hyphomicrobiales bacterium]MCP4999847.1 LysE family translocator [Hyphomicrobiales bacterium]
MSFETWALFIIASLPIHLAPGPNNLLALRNGGIDGAKLAAWAMTCRLPGYGLIFLAAALGMAAILLARPQLFAALTILGGLYIAKIGLSAMRVKLQDFETGSAAILNTQQRMREEFVTAVANPKAILFATAFYAQFIQPDMHDYVVRFAAMVAVSLSLEASAGLFYCFAGAIISIATKQCAVLIWVARFSGGFLCLIGLGLVLEVFF